MSSFLDNLKKAADSGEFNSEAAKKILEINKLADAKLGGGTAKELEEIRNSLKERYDKPTTPLAEGEIIEINSKYERKMGELKKQDIANTQLATLINIDEMIVESIEDMNSFITELEQRFEKEFNDEDQIFGDLSMKIESIKMKYKSIIN